MNCPNCGNPLSIHAEHCYEIYRGQYDSWCKSVGSVTYTCTSCGYELSVSEISDILTKVDEL